MTDRFVSAFQAGYVFSEVEQFLALPSDADRNLVRDAFAAPINPSVTEQTQFHPFGTRPTLSNLVTHINSSILPPEYAVSASTVQQEHVWRQGSWVCETIFKIVHNESGQNLTTSVTVNGELFTAHTYCVAAYEYH